MDKYWIGLVGRSFFQKQGRSFFQKLAKQAARCRFHLKPGVILAIPIYALFPVYAARRAHGRHLIPFSHESLLPFPLPGLDPGSLEGRFLPFLSQGKSFAGMRSAKAAMTPASSYPPKVILVHKI